jgi:hypothetical protein
MLVVLVSSKLHVFKAYSHTTQQLLIQYECEGSQKWMEQMSSTDFQTPAHFQNEWFEEL